MIGLVIYLIGVIATAVLCYLSLEKGYKVTVFDLFMGFLVSLCSWGAFITLVFIIYNDKVVFIKK